jgi:hypothetical protein
LTAADQANLAANSTVFDTSLNGCHNSMFHISKIVEANATKLTACIGDSARQYKTGANATFVAWFSVVRVPNRSFCAVTSCSAG